MLKLISTFLGVASSLIIGILPVKGEVNEIITVSVLKVVDGDTIRVLSNNEKVYVRLAYIDAPEVPHSSKDRTCTLSVCIEQYKWGNSTKAYLEDIVKSDSTIYLKVLNRDKYGRLVAEIYVRNNLVQKELLAQGLVRLYSPYYKKYPDYQTLEKIQQEAYLNHRGTWGDKQFLVPSVFRKKYNNESNELSN